MAITTSERNAIGRSILLAYGEDVWAMGKLVHYLRLELPAVAWTTVLTTAGSSWQPFRDSGLDITWWVSEINRIADMSW